MAAIRASIPWVRLRTFFLTVFLSVLLVPNAKSFSVGPFAAKLSRSCAAVNLMVRDNEERNTVISLCDAEVELNERQLCDVELLMQGVFSPLGGFMDEDNYSSVVRHMRLVNGQIFGIPVVYDTSNVDIIVGSQILLKHRHVPIAALKVTSKFAPDKVAEAKHCYGTTSIEHPGVRMICTERGRYYCGGALIGLTVPHREYPVKSPEQVRAELPPDTDVIAFQCRNPIHRAHYELITRALDDPSLRPGAVVLVHPTMGPTQDDDIPGALRSKTYEVLRRQIQNPRIHWAYLPYSMHMAGPREAIQHMIMRRNYGCTHFIIGRDMAGCKSSLTGKDFYGPYEAQNFALQHASEVGVTPLPAANLVYTAEEGYVTAEAAREKGLTVMHLSGTKFRQMLRAEEKIPEWFAFESVVRVLREEALREEAARRECPSRSET